MRRDSRSSSKADDSASERSLFAGVKELWDDEISRLKTSGASPNLIKLFRSRAAQELRELRRVERDEDRSDVPGRKHLLPREWMAWRQVVKKGFTTPGLGQAWLCYTPALIKRARTECRIQARRKVPVNHRLYSSRGVKAELSSVLQQEWDRYRVLATRLAQGQKAYHKRFRGPSKQASAFEAWRLANEFHAAVLMAVIAPNLPKAMPPAKRVARIRSVRDAVREALKSFSDAVPKQQKTLSVHTSRKGRRQISAAVTLAQGSCSARNSKGSSCTKAKSVKAAMVA